MGAETKFSFRAWSNILPTKPPEALIEGILLRGRLGVIFAQPDNGKTFVGLGMALSVGTGEDFAGRPVKKGRSIMIAAEGEYDLEQRAPAWRKLHHNAGEPEGGCYGEVVNFNDHNEVTAFLDEVKDKPLELLVIDTLAAVMVGGDEDRAKDMNFLISNVKRVMKATGCAALIIHHAGWDTKREKGSIALRAAADVVIETSLEDEKPDGSRMVTLTCRKMKSIRKFEPFSIALVPVTVDSPGGAFKCLAIGDAILIPGLEQVPSETERHGRGLVLILVKHFPEGATWTQLKDKSGLEKSTFKRGLDHATKTKTWIIGGRAQGTRYLLNPNNSWKAAVMGEVEVPEKKLDLDPLGHPYRGVNPVGPSLVRVHETSLDPVWTLDPVFETPKSENSPELPEMGADLLSKASELVEKVGAKPQARRKVDDQ